VSMVPLNRLIAPVQGRAGAAELPVYSVTKRAGFVPSAQYFKKQVFSSDLSTYKVVDKGQFAYATIHLDEGSIGIAPTRCVISPMYTVFSIDESRVSAEYLIRFLKSPRALASYPRLGRGTAERRKSISLDALGRLEVPLPPLPEQRRIAAILDEADALRAKRRRTTALLDEIPAVVFDSYEKSRWDAATVAEVAHLQGGITVNARRGTLPSTANYLRVANVFRGSIDLSELKRTGVTDREIARTRLQLDDVLVVEGHGNQAEVGRAALVETLPDGELTHQNHLFRLRPITARVSGRFLELSLNCATSREYFRRVANTTSGLNTLNATNVRALSLRIPPIGTQQEIAADIERARTASGEARQHESHLDGLFASLEHRAFRGEL